MVTEKKKLVVLVNCFYIVFPCVFWRKYYKISFSLTALISNKRKLLYLKKNSEQPQGLDVVLIKTMNNQITDWKHEIS